MKRCPQCRQFLNNEDIFCLNDGAALEMIESSANDTPTQVVSSPFSKAGTKTTGGTRFYWIISLMALMIVFLLGGVFFLLLRPMATQTAEKSGNRADNTQNAAPAENAALIVSNSAAPAPSSLPPVTTQAVKDLIERWEKAQDAQNFGLYQQCYGQPFLGIKRTKTGRVGQMNYGQWMNDRRQMLSKAVGLDIEIEGLNITIEGDTATAEFEQRYRSVSYSDRGPKILKMKMFSDGIKIVYEDLKASNPLN